MHGQDSKDGCVSIPARPDHSFVTMLSEFLYAHVLQYLALL
jgi:hypothetical protein